MKRSFLFPCAVIAMLCLCAADAFAQAPTMTPEQVIQWAKTLPPGTEIDFEQVSSSEIAKGQGAGLSASGDGVNQTVDSSAPSATLSGGSGASGGATKSKSSAFKLQTDWLPILCWVAGVGCLGYGAYQFKLGSIKNATSFAVVGGAFIAVGFFPALLLFGLAGIAIYLLVKSGVLSQVAGKVNDLQSESTANHEALRAVAAGVSDFKDANPAAYAALLNLISKHASEGDKTVIKAVRKADDLN